MRIGIGLPSTIPGAVPEQVMAWAAKAEAGPFSSVSTIGRHVYDNYESLTTLAVVAGATRRVRLITAVLIAPAYHPVQLAKEAATIDALSGGRLTLGMGVGWRPDDYHATGTSFSDRGKRFEAQIATMKRVWSGKELGDGIGAIGPKPHRPGGPEILIGGATPAALQRAGRLGDGFIAVPDTLDAMRQQFETVEDAWKAAGKSGKPRFANLVYFALGPGVGDRAAAYVRDYYKPGGPEMQNAVAGSIMTQPEAIKGFLKAVEGIGTDEVIFVPTLSEEDQLTRLADLIA